MKSVINSFGEEWNRFDQENFLPLDERKSQFLRYFNTSHFKKLKSQESRLGFTEAVSGTFFRKGKQNQWKNVLNAQQINKLENKFRDFMNKFGYD